MAQNLVHLDDHLYQAISHNPEAVGSSPTSATIKSPDFTRNQDFFFAFYPKKFGVKIYECRF